MRGRKRKHHQDNEIHQPRVEKAQRDKPKGRRSIGEMDSTPKGDPIRAGGVWKTGDNLVVLRFQLLEIERRWRMPNTLESYQ